MNAQQRKQVRRLAEAERKELLAEAQVSHQRVVDALTRSLAEARAAQDHTIEVLVKPLLRRLGAKTHEETQMITQEALAEAISRRLNRLDDLEGEYAHRGQLIAALDESITELHDQLKAAEVALAVEQQKDHDARSLRRRLQERSVEIENLRKDLADAARARLESQGLLLTDLPVFRSPRGR